MRPCAPIKAADTVPESLVIRRQPGGYAKDASPDGNRAAVQPAGGLDARTQPNGPAARTAARPPPDEDTADDDPAPPQPTMARAAESAMPTNSSLERLDVAIAVARSAVVVGVMVAAVVLGNPAGRGGTLARSHVGRRRGGRSRRARL